jgi:hypothetical protein
VKQPAATGFISPSSRRSSSCPCAAAGVCRKGGPGG